MLTMTRQQFIDAVEFGIQHAGDQLTEPEKMMLRHVAQTATETARGTMETEVEGHVCGCPLVTAGIYTNNTTIKPLGQFWGAFDGYTMGLLNSNGTYVRIVG